MVINGVIYNEYRCVVLVVENKSSKIEKTMPSSHLISVSFCFKSIIIEHTY